MSQLLKPPAVPVAILNFFASQPDFSAVSGDISEEFQQRAQTSGPQAARRWYWREAFRNALALTWRELMRTPVRTLVTASGCFLAANAVVALYVGIRWYFFPGTDDDLLFDRNHQRTVLLLLHFIPCLVTGWAGGRLLRGREWALALMFTLVSGCLVLMGTWYLFFWIRVDLSSYMLVGYMITGNILRQVFFWLGSLGIRHLRIRQGRSARLLPAPPGSPSKPLIRQRPDPRLTDAVMILLNLAEILVWVYPV